MNHQDWLLLQHLGHYHTHQFSSQVNVQGHKTCSWVILVLLSFGIRHSTFQNYEYLSVGAKVLVRHKLELSIFNDVSSIFSNKAKLACFRDTVT